MWQTLVQFLLGAFILLQSLQGSFAHRLSGHQAKERLKSAVNEVKTPIIIIPGSGGSQIEAKLDKPSVTKWYCYKTTSDFFTLWLEKSSLLPGPINCFSDNMRVLYDKNTNTVGNNVGVQTRIPGFGATDTIEYLDTDHLVKYFAPMVDSLVSWGYERKVSVRAAPFDFRYAPDTAGAYFDELRQLIEESFTNNGNKKVTLLSHSLGCPYTLVFLNKQSQDWKDKFIYQWITLSGVWGGTATIVRLFTSGDTLGIPHILVNPLTIRDGQRTGPSNAFLLPSRELWRPDEVLVTTAERNYTAYDYDALFTDIGFLDGIYIRRNVEHLTFPLSRHFPNLKVHCLHGSGVDTPESFAFSKGQFPDVQPRTTNGDGDGTVNLRSLQACKIWSQQQAHKVVLKDFDGVHHNGILSDENVHNYIKELLLL